MDDEDKTDNNKKDKRHINLIINKSLPWIGKRKFIHIVFGDDVRYMGRDYLTTREIRRNKIIVHICCYLGISIIAVIIINAIFGFIFGYTLSQAWTSFIVSLL